MPLGNMTDSFGSFCAATKQSGHAAINRHLRCRGRTDAARTTDTSSDWISNVYNLPRAKNDAAFNANSKLNTFQSGSALTAASIYQFVRLPLAVTTNGLDVFVDDAVLSHSIMIFNIFILCIALGVVILPSNNSNGVTCLLGRS